MTVAVFTGGRMPAPQLAELVRTLGVLIPESDRILPRIVKYHAGNRIVPAVAEHLRYRLKPTMEVLDGADVLVICPTAKPMLKKGQVQEVAQRAAGMNIPIRIIWPDGSTDRRG